MTSYIYYTRYLWQMVAPVTDQEALDMAHWVLRNEGLFIGSSSSMNIVAACRAAAGLEEGSTTVTIICDSGRTHLSRFWNEEYTTKEFNLVWPKSGKVPSCLDGL